MLISRRSKILTQLTYKEDDSSYVQISVYHSYVAHCSFGDPIFAISMAHPSKPVDEDDDEREPTFLQFKVCVHAVSQRAMYYVHHFTM